MAHKISALSKRAMHMEFPKIWQIKLLVNVTQKSLTECQPSPEECWLADCISDHIPATASQCVAAVRMGVSTKWEWGNLSRLTPGSPTTHPMMSHTHDPHCCRVGHCWMLTAAWKHLRQRQAAILSAVLTRLALTPSTPSHHVQCSHICQDLFCPDLQSSSLNIWSFCTVEFVGWFAILTPHFLKSSAALLPPADQLLAAVTFLHWPEAKLDFENFFHCVLMDLGVYVNWVLAAIWGCHVSNVDVQGAVA